MGKTPAFKQEEPGSNPDWWRNLGIVTAVAVFVFSYFCVLYFCQSVTSVWFVDLSVSVFVSGVVLEGKQVEPPLKSDLIPSNYRVNFTDINTFFFKCYNCTIILETHLFFVNCRQFLDQIGCLFALIGYFSCPIWQHCKQVQQLHEIQAPYLHIEEKQHQKY